MCFCGGVVVVVVVVLFVFWYECFQFMVDKVQFGIHPFQPDVVDERITYLDRIIRLWLSFFNVYVVWNN